MTTNQPTEINAIDALCASTGMTVQDLAVCMRALKGRMLQSETLRSMAQNNSREDFYTGLFLAMDEMNDAFLGASDDIAAMWESAGTAALAQLATI